MEKTYYRVDYVICEEFGQKTIKSETFPTFYSAKKFAQEKYCGVEPVTISKVTEKEMFRYA